MSHTNGIWFNRHWNSNGQMEVHSLGHRGPSSRPMIIVNPPMSWDAESEEWKCRPEDVEECEANARLVAAAPELLASIRAILVQVIQGKVLERDACLSQAQAALREAVRDLSGLPSY